LAALQRTSAAALYLGFSTILFFGTGGIWRLVLPIAGTLGLPALMVFSETFRKRMFFGEANPDQILNDPTKALASVNGSGRFTLWDSMLRRFFDPHPVVGSGIGSTQDYLYTTAGTGVVHSEYVRLLCEVGIVGLALFALMVASYLLRLRRYTARNNSVSLRTSALAGIGSLVAYIVYFSTDNGIDYVSQFGIYVFALVATAIKARELACFASMEKAEAPSARLPAFPNLMR
jgi:O-antigen ligase